VDETVENPGLCGWRFCVLGEKKKKKKKKIERRESVLTHRLFYPR
jgi:hypothetical protein